MNCRTCGNETTNPKYCSRSCAAKETGSLYPKRKITRKCSRCDNKIAHWKTTLCVECAKKDADNNPSKRKSMTIADYISRDSLKNQHPSSKFAHIRALARSWFKDLIKLPCHNCGYDKHVELCHIKPLSSFSNNAKLSEVNSSDNIVQLCPNCHWEFDKGILEL